MHPLTKAIGHLVNILQSIRQMLKVLEENLKTMKTTILTPTRDPHQVVNHLRKMDSVKLSAKMSQADITIITITMATMDITIVITKTLLMEIPRDTLMNLAVATKHAPSLNEKSRNAWMTPSSSGTQVRKNSI